MKIFERYTIIFLVLLMLTCVLASFAKLSDETLEIVDDLRWKHSGLTLFCTDEYVVHYVEPEWEYLSFENGILYVETQDGKWFVEMERIEE